MERPGRKESLFEEQEKRIDLVQRSDGAWEVPADRAAREKAFDGLLSSVRASGPGATIEYSLPYPKYLFLEWAVRSGSFLLHGSNGEYKKELLPRHANDSVKQSGNQIGVYAVTDPILPLFYAIKDRQRFRGLAVSGVEQERQTSGLPKLHYHFAVPEKMLAAAPWSQGMVYLLSRESFTEQLEAGIPTGEWVSLAPVAPVAALPVEPADFPFLSQIEGL